MSPEELRPLYERILARYPAAADFEPCDCGVTIAVIPRALVQEGLHFLIEDEEFRLEALRVLAAHPHLPNARYATGVLILGERA